MKRVTRVVKAAGTFLATLVRRRDRVDGRAPGGYPVLESWDRSPEQEIVDSHRATLAAGAPAARAALYCYEGPHRGEVLLLRNDVETLGAGVGSSVVVTPRSATRDDIFQLSLARGLRLVAGPGATFRLNGTLERDSELYDYDRLDLFDNRFVVLNLHGVTA